MACLRSKTNTNERVALDDALAYVALGDEHQRTERFEQDGKLAHDVEAAREELRNDAFARGGVDAGKRTRSKENEQRPEREDPDRCIGGRDERAAGHHFGEPSEMEFLTDRGLRRLPAWRLLAEGAMGPIWILDPEVALWQPSGAAEVALPKVQAPAQDPGARIEIAGDDRTVTLHWLGAAPEYECYPSAETVESDQAVALVAHGRDSGSRGIRLAIGHVHRVPAILQAPLGARVFVDLQGNAGRVIRS